MQIQALGHVVLKVRDLQLSVPFYTQVLGLIELFVDADPQIWRDYPTAVATRLPSSFNPKDLAFAM